MGAARHHAICRVQFDLRLTVWNAGQLVCKEEVRVTNQAQLPPGVSAPANAEPIEFSFGSGAYTATYDKFGVAARFGTLFASSPNTTGFSRRRNSSLTLSISPHDS